MNLYFVVTMEPTSHNETFNTLKIGLEVQACLNHSALANANVRKSKELGKNMCCQMAREKDRYKKGSAITFHATQ
jgi:hypothetical protein